MELWQTITAAVLGNAAVLAVLGLLAKSLLEKVLARDAKRFEVELNAKANAAIEELKSQLQLRLLEHQVKLSSLHERRATTIAELNALLAEAMWEAEAFLSPLQAPGSGPKTEQRVQAMNKFAEFFRHFDKHRIYLPAALCESMEELVHQVRAQVIHFGVYVGLDEQDASHPQTEQERLDAWLEGWRVLRTEVPKLRARLEQEFRALLAPGG